MNTESSCPGRRLAALAAAVLLFAAAASAKPRVVVLGFDGVDAHIVEQMMRDGRLPHLKALADRGGYSELLPPVPAQTPVSWSSFATGLDPGSTEIFDFLKRDPKTLVPTFAVVEEGEGPFLLGDKNSAAAAAAVLLLLGVLPAVLIRRRLASAGVLLVASVLATGVFIVVRKDIPTRRPTVTNNRRGVPLWTAAANAGKKTVVIRMPVTFPPDEFPNGRLLSGLGVPDLSARIGRPSFYTSDPFFTPRGGNDFSVEIIRLPSNTGTIETHIVGPPGKLFGREGWIDAPLQIIVDRDGSGATLATSGQRIHLKVGQWSDWVPITFRVNFLVRVHGIGKFRLNAVSPEIRLYLTPVQFDPRALPPGLAITSPAEFARSLVQQIGVYKTVGWGIDTWSIQAGTIDEAVFLEDVRKTEEQWERLLDTLLADRSLDLAVQYFEFPDRVAHVFWRFRDPQHPAYDPKLARIYGDAVEKTYEQMDAIVGKAERAMQPGDSLVVLSDHGFSTWRRAVNYDTWLVQNGYLVLKGEAQKKNLEELFSHGTFWDAVDWSRTRAYAMGLGDIYINLAGREAHGIVKPGAEYEALRQEIIAKLSQLVDPKTGHRAVSRVLTREQAYQRFDPSLIPDLFALNTEGYRVAWQAALGVPTDSVFEDNDAVWSGDHCSLDPEIVPGILFASQPIHVSRTPSIEDVYPSLLKLLGVAPPPDIEGRSIW